MSLNKRNVKVKEKALALDSIKRFIAVRKHKRKSRTIELGILLTQKPFSEKTRVATCLDNHKF